MDSLNSKSGSFNVAPLNNLAYFFYGLYIIPIFHVHVVDSIIILLCDWVVFLEINVSKVRN